jgi:hypothetical protein
MRFNDTPDHSAGSVALLIQLIEEIQRTLMRLRPDPDVVVAHKNIAAILIAETQPPILPRNATRSP